MPSLASIGDAAAVDNRYADRVIVYVEGDGDQKLFSRIVTSDVRAQLEFKVPNTAGGGCRVVMDRVAAERPTNPKVYGLLDGETAAVLGAIDALLDAQPHLFQVANNPAADGLIFLSAHELENVVLLHGDVCDLVAKNTALAKMGAVSTADVAKTLRKLAVRFFMAALMKYASVHVGRSVADPVLIPGGHFVDGKRSALSLLREMRAKVIAAGGNWAAYRVEMHRILAQLKAQFGALGLNSDARSRELLRLADGKNLLSGLRQAHGHTPQDGLLADALTRPPYAEEFTTQLMALTNAA